MQTNVFREQLFKYLKYKYWIVFSLVLSIFLAYVYLRYATPKYQAKATIQIVKEKSAASQLSVFSDLNILPGSSSSVLDEIEVLSSRSNISQVIEKLKLHKRVFHVGNVKSSEVYGKPPVDMLLGSSDSLFNDRKFSFYIVPKSMTNFTYLSEENEEKKDYVFGDEIDTEIGKITLLPKENDILKRFIGEKLRLEILPINEAALNYKKALRTSILDDFSSVINITLQDAVKQKAVDFLDELIRVYVENGKRDKRRVADRTADFIDDRIADIYNDLADADQSAEDFKAGRGLTDIQSQSNINLNVSATNQQELQSAQIQLDIASSVSSLLDSQEGFDILPANVGLTDPSINNATARYNQLVSQREQLLRSSNEKNPVIVNIDEQLDNLKTSMKSSLNSMTNNLNLKANKISSQLATLNSKIYSAPRNERALRDITRKQQTVEGLYLYLLQKREEAQIAYASAAPNSKLVDPAFPTSKFPVSPKKLIIYLVSFVLGLAVPIGAIYGLELLDNKIHNLRSIQKLGLDIPVIGELPRLKKNSKKVIEKNDRSVLSEALRIIRTNLDYLLKTALKNGLRKNVIYVTSGLPEEGKTFFSTNLAMILSNSNKKVILIGADIRNPKFYSFFETDNTTNIQPFKNRKVGLTDYLFDESIAEQEIVNHETINDNKIDIIYSGKIYPNPSELLMNGRIEKLLENVTKKYDYVIMDTAPMMPVTDTVLISEYASLIIYVTRAGKTPIGDLEYPLSLKNDGKLKNLAFVVNDVRNKELGYGGNYGYGYGAKKKKWWALN